MSALTKCAGLVAGLSAVGVIGVAVAQSVPPNPLIKNPAIGAGQQTVFLTPMGETGVLAPAPMAPVSTATITKEPEVAAAPAPAPEPVAAAPAPAEPVAAAPEPAPSTVAMGAAPEPQPAPMRAARHDRN